ncbi:putative NACHT [Triplophysa rosa]|uniref:NACHT n=1 Tax=Triplophysa rosa TaxID=992332 RepID=A0A9W7W954_TRIRA|nr:putative NACHT [Triplophysa rosa]
MDRRKGMYRVSSDSSIRSCVSLEMDESVDQPVKLSSADYRLGMHKRKSDPCIPIWTGESAEPSCVSMKSGESMDHPVKFNSRGVLKLRMHKQKSESSRSSWIRRKSAEPSCVSMKSVESMDHPVKFSLGDFPAELRESSETINASNMAEESMNQPEIISSRDSPAKLSTKVEEAKSSVEMKQLNSIFKDLENKMISLIKNELKKFKMLLSSSYPQCSKREEDDEGQSKVKEGVLKITLHILRETNQMNLANTLLTKLISVHQQKLKSRLKEKFKSVSEGISTQGSSALVNEIYTELYITEGGSEDINNEHEVRQIEMTSWRPEAQDSPIKCNDIFTAGQNKRIRSVLTKGVAGIGKTVSVQKFILDWAEGKANQDLNFIFPLPFRELNLIKETNLRLNELLGYFFTEMKEINLGDFTDYKVMFIFDGLDECQLHLDFQNHQNFSDVSESASVDVLLTNLIKGNLLPSALIWITSRPAAANQIPPECVDLITDVRGFNDPQKDEYFRKRINDQTLANRIIRHIKLSRSLYIMCHIPVFCWISATVLQRMLSEEQSEAKIPKTLTQMFTHFLIFQIKLKRQKYDGENEDDLYQARKSILSLGKLAFQQLEKGNLIFYEGDLRESGIDVKEASLHSGVCTQIFREEFGFYLGKVFSFVHLSVQEFFAALYKFFCIFEDEGQQSDDSFTESLKIEVDKALQSKNGHWDLYLRFLLGLSLESNQIHLQGLLKNTGGRSYKIKKVVKYIKDKIKKNLSTEKSINLFYCLNELNDNSLVKDIQSLLSSTADFSGLSGIKLSSSQWSALVFVLLSSEQELDEFQLSKYEPSEECLLRLMPVVKASRKADLSGCNLTEKSCSALVSVLSSNFSFLRELNLSNNKLQDSAVKLLSAGLKNPHCTLETLQLENCTISDKGCTALASALQLNPSHLRELNLNFNALGPRASGLKLLSGLLKDSHCKLEKLQLSDCGISDKGCAALASALKSNPSHLRELNLKYNNSGDSGVKLLSDLLKDPHCRLEKVYRDISDRYWKTLKDSVVNYSPSSCSKPCSNTSTLSTEYQNVAPLQKPDLISLYQQKLKSRLKEKFKSVNEGISLQGSSALVNEIYTELYITEGGNAGVNNEHEVRQIEMTSWRPDTRDTAIKCNDIFKLLPGQNKPIRTVLTKGIAGIGKTVSVQKFILDWAEGKVNQDLHFIFSFPFRELNLMKEINLSLIELLGHYVTEIKEINVGDFTDYRIMFIFDGLDECRLHLNFQNHQSFSDVNESASVDVLLTNLIKGNLLPSALIWITSRPAAANQIPLECIDQVTEVQGFNDPQKDEYFRKRISDQSLANRIITHIKLSRSLYIMCHIPVFCWISATVLQRMLSEEQSEAKIPKTLTQMFTHFLIFQIKLKRQKYDGENEDDLYQARKSILSLGKLAFQQLEKGNLIFYEEDLRESGIDVKEASLHSGVCTQIFREEFGFYLGKVFSFVHLSVQEFIAALYKFFYIFEDEGQKSEDSFTESLKIEVDKALQSKNGHWDLFLRFLLGLSLESNQILIQGLLKNTGGRSYKIKKVVKYIKDKIKKNLSTEKSINLFYCLNELNDNSLVKDVQSLLSSTADFSGLSGIKLSSSQWSALVFVLLNSEQELDEFQLRKYEPSEECLLRLMPVVKSSRKVDLSGCNLTEKSCPALISVLSSNLSFLRELNLSNNKLQDSGAKLISAGMKNPHCTLETLQLENCTISDKGCAALASALQLNPSHLRELNLNFNALGPRASGLKLLSGLLKDSHCKLEKLEMSDCSISDKGCAALASALKLNPSHLRELNLKYNNPGDSGVKLLSDLLKDPQCRLEKV